MRVLATIPIALKFDTFDVDFEYATPFKIDLFSLIILDCIKKYPNKNQSFTNVLAELDIPPDLHYLFEKQINDLINTQPNNILPIPNYSEEYLALPIRMFQLTKIGEETYRTGEKPIEIKNDTVEFIIDSFQHKLIKQKENKRLNPSNFIEIEASIFKVENDFMGEKNEINEYIKSILNKTPEIYIKDAVKKTIVYNSWAKWRKMSLVPENIEIIQEVDKITFSNTNPKVKEAVIQAIKPEHQYFQIVETNNNSINLSEVRILTVGKKFEMNSAYFFSEAALKFAESKFAIVPFSSKIIENSIHIKNSITADYQFMGIDGAGKPVLLKYANYSINNFRIPLYEISNNEHEYLKLIEPIIKSLLEEFAVSKNTRTVITGLYFLPKLKQSEFLNEALLIIPELNFDRKIQFLRELKKEKSASIEFHGIIGQYSLEFMTNEIKTTKIQSDKIIQISQEFNIPHEKYFKLLSENYKHSNELINKLLLINANATITIFRLKELYYNKLTDNSIAELNHKCQLFTNFKLVASQFEELKKKYKFNDFFDFKLPETKEWKDFYNAIFKLKKLFGVVKQDLPNEYQNQATDFFNNIQDLYYEFAEVKENALIQKPDEKSPDFIGMAANLRSKIEDEIKLREKTNGLKSGELKGQLRIKSVFNDNDADAIYKAWKTLSALIHNDNEHPIVKSNADEKKRVLNNISEVVNKLTNKNASTDKLILKEKESGSTVNAPKPVAKPIIKAIETKEAATEFTTKHEQTNKAIVTQQSKTVFDLNNTSKQFAVIELSTKAVKLLIGPDKEKFEKNGFVFKDFERISERTETGKCLDINNKFDLYRFKNQVIKDIDKAIYEIKARNINIVYTVATAAYRIATNNKDILKLIKDECGLNVKILTKEEEAAATLFAFHFSKPANVVLDSNIMMVDQGGGSTEISVFNKEELIESKSLDIGTTMLQTILFDDLSLSIPEALAKCDLITTERLNRFYGNLMFLDKKSIMCISVGTAITKATGKQNTDQQHGTILTIKNIEDRIKGFDNELCSKFRTLADLKKDIENLQNKNNPFAKVLSASLGLPMFTKIMDRFNIKSVMVSGTPLWYGIYFENLYKIQK